MYRYRYVSLYTYISQEFGMFAKDPDKL